MSSESTTRGWLTADAAISWVAALPGLVDPVGVAAFFWPEEPTYGFLVRLWSGLVFLFGWISWEASRNVAAQRVLLKYVWIEKAIVALTVLVGHLAGEAPPSLMGSVMAANLPWIPAFLYFDLSARKRGRSEAPKPGLAV